jgi:thiamine kinase-like enzyme
MSEHEVLQDDPHRQVLRVGDTVRRPMHPWSAAVHELLRHLVWCGTRPVGILDWDYAWPNRKVHDIAYALEYVAPFRDDDECVRWLRYPAPPDRRRRLERFAAAYGLTSIDGLVDEVIDQQQRVLDRTRHLAADGRQPQLSWQDNGTLDKIAKRIDWSRQHRHLFE